jgi:hypothetical protein
MSLLLYRPDRLEFRMYILSLDVHGDYRKYNHRQNNERINMDTNQTTTTRDRRRKQSIEVQQYRE